MKLLVIDTATRIGSVAAIHDGTVAHEVRSDQQTRHAERLLGMVDEVLAGAGWTLGDVGLIVSGMGPGSFTGVRVGMATAKGLAFACGIPLVGVVSLDAMAHAARELRGAVPVVALLDAKKNEVFLSAYEPSGEPAMSPVHMPRAEVLGWLRDSTLPAVQQALVIGEVARELGLPETRLLQDSQTDLPAALPMALLAIERWTREPVDAIDSLEPLYVRPPDIHLPASASRPPAKSTSSPLSE